MPGKYSLVLLLKEGKEQADGTEGIPTPTENNLQYIDQQNINTEKKATFDLFPKSLERGVYNVYVSTDKVTLKKVASFEYNTEPEYMPGDADDNGKVNSNDAVAVLLYVVDKYEMSAKQLLAANVNGDNKVDANDAVGILLHVVGKYDFK